MLTRQYQGRCLTSGLATEGTDVDDVKRFRARLSCTQISTLYQTIQRRTIPERERLPIAHPKGEVKIFLTESTDRQLQTLIPGMHSHCLIRWEVLPLDFPGQQSIGVAIPFSGYRKRAMQ